MPVTPPAETEEYFLGSEEEDQESLEGWCVRCVDMDCICVENVEREEQYSSQS